MKCHLRVLQIHVHKTFAPHYQKNCFSLEVTFSIRLTPSYIGFSVPNTTQLPLQPYSAHSFLFQTTPTHLQACKLSRLGEMQKWGPYKVRGLFSRLFSQPVCAQECPKGPTKIFQKLSLDTAMLFSPFGCIHPPPFVPPFLLANNLQMTWSEMTSQAESFMMATPGKSVKQGLPGGSWLCLLQAPVSYHIW